MSKKVIRTNEKLWEQVKQELYESDKGGLPYTWSARKSQFAVQEYKRRGGEYIGKKSKDNPLVIWTEQDWQYITPTSMRYLPKEIIERLSPAEKRRETLLKKDKIGEHVPYSTSVLRKFSKL